MTEQINGLPHNGLPVPDDAARAHSQRVQQYLRDILHQQGRMDFSQYMQAVLYAPGLGYYSAGGRKFGEQGDFVTAPVISPLFSQCLAQGIFPVLETINDKNILEVGAGNGMMAAEMLATFEQLGVLPTKYYILELSADLRERQIQLISARVPHLAKRVEWLDALPDAFNGIVIANELLDAMPVRRFKINPEGVGVQTITAKDGTLMASYETTTETRLLNRIAAIETGVGKLPEGYTSEINFTAEEWLQTLADSLNSGAIILFDYGYPMHEYYHPQRASGTLSCFYQHRRHDDPFVYPGLQDITAHIDFTALKQVAENSMLELIGFTNQANFLFGCGLAALIQNNPQQDLVKQLETANQIKKLTMPYEMGEVMKVIGFAKNATVRMAAFEYHDMREHLQ